MLADSLDLLLASCHQRAKIVHAGFFTILVYDINSSGCLCGMETLEFFKGFKHVKLVLKIRNETRNWFRLSEPGATRSHTHDPFGEGLFPPSDLKKAKTHVGEHN